MLETESLKNKERQRKMKDILGISNTIYQQTESQKVDYLGKSDYQWIMIGHSLEMQSKNVRK